MEGRGAKALAEKRTGAAPSRRREGGISGSVASLRRSSSMFGELRQEGDENEQRNRRRGARTPKLSKLDVFLKPRSCWESARASFSQYKSLEDELLTLLYCYAVEVGLLK